MVTPAQSGLSRIGTTNLLFDFGFPGFATQLPRGAFFFGDAPQIFNPERRTHCSPFFSR